MEQNLTKWNYKGKILASQNLKTLKFPKLVASTNPRHKVTYNKRFLPLAKRKSEVLWKPKSSSRKERRRRELRSKNEIKSVTRSEQTAKHYSPQDTKSMLNKQPETQVESHISSSLKDSRTKCRTEAPKLCTNVTPKSKEINIRHSTSLRGSRTTKMPRTQTICSTLISILIMTTITPSILCMAYLTRFKISRGKLRS